MKKIFLTFVISLLLCACDKLYGLRMSVRPASNASSWACATEGMLAMGYVLKVEDAGQFSVSNESGGWLFSAFPDRNGEMDLYFHTLHSKPRCDHVENSYVAMKALLNVLESSCNYSLDNYTVEFECENLKLKQQENL